MSTFKLGTISRFQVFVSVIGVFMTASVLAQTQSLYDREYPAMAYSSTAPQDAIANLQQRIDRGELVLEYRSKHGYLNSVLRALELDISSQLLVFSKTSLQSKFISPANPRAIYFGDNVYVGWVQEAEALEIASMDPNLGPLFYTLRKSENDQPVFERHTKRCLRCHDSYSMTGGGTPRFIMASGYTGRQGQMVSHEGRIMTDTSTRFKHRWGGWYVTGNHGEQLHLGNVVVESGDDLKPANLAKTGNITDLKPLTNTEPYLSGYSDIVALLVIEHQVEVQNLIARVNYLTRTALTDENPLPLETRSRLEALAERLVRSMLMVKEAAFTSLIRGVSGFTEKFSSLGPHDSRGRSLRDLDLQERLFRYPLSYLVYSDAFAALPELVKRYVSRRFGEVLSGQDQSQDFAHLSSEDKVAILEIMNDTQPGFLID